MKLSVPALAVVLALGSPLAALAQTAPAAPAPGAWTSPDPAMRAAMQKAQADARTATYNELSADHRAAVQTIVDAVNAGTQTDMRAAATQIDAILTPDEAKAVLADARKVHEAMRASMPAHAARTGADASAPGNPAAEAKGMHDGEHMQRHADAGRVLLQLGLTPERMQALHAARMAGQKPN